MSRDLPEFQRQVGITPAAAPDVQSKLDATANALSQFSQGVLASRQRLVDVQAAQAGAEAGEAPDFKGKLAPGATEATRAFNQAALASNKMQNQFNIRSGIQNIAADITRPGNLNFFREGTANFDTQVTALWNSMAPNIPKQNFQVAQNAFQFEANNARNAILRKQQVLGTNIARQFYRDSLLQANNASNNLAFNKHTIGSLGVNGQMDQATNAAVQSEILTPQEGQNIKRNQQESLQNSNILGGFENALNDGTPEQYIKDFSKAKLPEVTAEQHSQLLVQMTGMQANHDQSARMRQKAVQQKLQEQNTAFQKGQQVDPVLLAQFQAQHPEEWAQIQGKLIASKLYGATLGAMRFLGVNDRTTVMQMLTQNLREQPDSFNKQQLLNAVGRGSNQQVKLMLDDAHGYFQSAPSVQDVLSARQLSVTARADANPAVTPIINEQGGLNVGRLMWPVIDAGKLAPLSIDPIQVSLNMQADAGVPPEKQSVMSRATAADFVTEIKSLPLDQQIQALHNIIVDPNNGFDEHQDIALRDLNKAGLPFSHQYILSASNNNASRPFVVDMILAKSQTPLERKNTLEVALNRANLGRTTGLVTKATITSAVVDNLQDFTASLGGGNAATIQLQAQTTADVEELTAVLMAAKGESTLKAAKDAADSIVNNNYQYISQAGSNVPLRVRAGRDKEQIFAAGNNLKAQALNATLIIPPTFKAAFPGVQPERLQVLYKDQIQRDGSLISNGATNAVILLDGNQRPVLTQTGSRIMATYKEIDDPTSALHQEIVPPPGLIFQAGLVPGAAIQAGEISPPIAGIGKVISAGERGARETLELAKIGVGPALTLKGVEKIVLPEFFSSFALQNLIKEGK